MSVEQSKIHVVDNNIIEHYYSKENNKKIHF